MSDMNPGIRNQFTRVFISGLAAVFSIQSAIAEPLIHKDLAYVSGGHERQVLDLYLPESEEGEDKLRPVIVWIHGGAWRAGSKRGVRWQPMVERGYAVAAINYRLSQHATFPAQIHDCKAAIRFLRHHAAHYGLDSERFGVWGSSAGGHLSALVGTSGNAPELEGNIGILDQPSHVQAVCDWFGPTDFSLMNVQAGPTGVIDHDSPDSPESQLVGSPVATSPEKVKRVNPITYVDSEDPPFLIVHGNADKLVPIGQSKLLQAALLDAGVSSSFHIVLDGGHGWFRNPAINEKCLDFFDNHLNP